MQHILEGEAAPSRFSAPFTLIFGFYICGRDVRVAAMIEINNFTSKRWDPLWIFALCAICFCWALGDAPLAGTEAFRALTANQMLDSGDWVLPRLYGQLYLRKPPMQYWVLALAEQATGQANEWVWRLPSALGAALLGAFLCRTGQRWWGRREGLATGLAFLSIAALWSQFRSADIDALNTVATIITAVALLDIYRDECRKKWAWMIGGGLAFGASLLLKGPASLPLVIGAFFGPPILNSNFKKMRSIHAWGLLAIGCALFGAYLLAVYNAIGSLNDPAATSGLREAGDKMLISNWSNFAEALLLPLLLFAYALPCSLSLPFLLLPSTLKSLDSSNTAMLRALLGTLLLAIVIGIVTGMQNPRYGYILLPILVLLTGLSAHAILSGRLANNTIRLANKTILGAAILLCIAIIVIAVLLNSHGVNLPGILLSLLAIGVVFGLLLAWRRANLRLLYTCTTAAIVLLAFSFDYMKNEDRRDRSGLTAGLMLAETVGAKTTVTTGLMLWTHPEIFHYAKVTVNAHNRYVFANPFDLRKTGWILFHKWEWSEWSQRYPDRFSKTIELPTHVKGTVLTWYDGGRQESEL